MSTYRLKNLLSPHSVALIGASPRHGSVGRAILNNIRKAQFKGEFGLVNPRYPEIDGVATVRSIEKLAFAPELVVITELLQSADRGDNLELLPALQHRAREVWHRMTADG